jgi:hypothetical protein
MAAISITLNDEGLATITLDQFEWTDFYVNDKLIPNGRYVQTHPGTVFYRAYASGDLVPVNPPIIQELKIQNNGENATGILDFSALSLSDGSTLCSGQIIVENGFTQNAQNGPLVFSQGRMTGEFSYIS